MPTRQWIRNVALLVWRRLGVQTLRRHYASLAFEVIFVALVFYEIMALDRVDLRRVTRLNRSHVYVEEPVPFARLSRQVWGSDGGTGANPNHVDIVYGPKNAFTDKLLNTAATLFAAARRSVRFLGFEDARGVTSGCHNVWKTLLLSLNFDLVLDRVLCVQFVADTHKKTNDNKSLSYNLVMYVPPELMLQPRLVLGVHGMFENNMFTANAEKMFKITQTLKAQQWLMDNAHIYTLRSRSNITYEAYEGSLPGLPPFNDMPTYRSGLFKAMTVAFCLPFIFRIRDVTNEIGSGMMQQQGLMGLSPSQFWLGHFLAALFLAMVESGCACYFLLFAEQDYEPRLEYCGDTTCEHRSLNGTYTSLYDTAPESTRYLQNATFSLVFVALVIFNICHTLLALLVACILPLGRWAMVLGFGAYFLVPVYDDEKFGILFGQSLLGYLTESKVEKLRKAIYPNVAASTVLKIIGIFDDFEKNADWSLVGTPALSVDTVTVAEMWLAMGAAALCNALLIWYLSKVLPWTAATPLSPFFPCMPSYWHLGPAIKHVDAILPPSGVTSPNRFEQPPIAPVIIECKHLVKTFDTTLALAGIDLTIHKTQVTVLLGHNGAGKTTLMSILTGVLTPTSGSVTVAGHEIGSTAARKSVGFCPQFDVFFTDLTVSEHLRYFSLLRGVDYSKTSNNVKQLLSRIELEDKVNAFPDELSGGMKRKLSLALALVTGPSVLILDEPTTGMDPDTRRTIWQLVQELRGKKTTIVMSTHDMEEADVLGDRIIVMYSGRVVCNGSPSFLKNACGVGYELNIEKAQTGLNVPGVLAVVREVAPEATVKAEKEGEVCIALHTFKRAGFPRMFNVLETKGRTELGVQSLGVSVATMKDAYIKIYREWVAKESNAVVDPRTAKLTDEHVSVVRSPSVLQQSWALLQKRFNYLKRTPFLFFTGWILPVLIAYLGQRIVQTTLFDFTPALRYIDFDVRSYIGERDGLQQPAVGTFMQETGSSKASGDYRVLLESAGLHPEPMNDALDRLLRKSLDNFYEYAETYAFGGVFKGTRIEAWTSALSLVGPSVHLNLVDTALLRTYTGVSSSRIRAGVSLHTLSAAELGRSGESYDPAGSRSDPRAALLELLTDVNAYWGVLACVSFGLLAGSFAVLPSVEVYNDARRMQLMTGVSPLVYLGTHFLFDLLFYLLPMTAIYVGFALLKQLSARSAAALGVIMVAFAPVAILLPYLVAEHSQIEGAAYAVVLGIFSVAGPGVTIAYLLGKDFDRDPRLLFTFFPPFAISAATIRTVNLDFEEATCHYIRRQKVDRDMQRFCQDVKRVGSAIVFCCDIVLGRTTKSWRPVELLSTSEYGILPDVLIMFVEGLLIFVYLLFRLSAGFLPSMQPPRRKITQQKIEQDVAAERSLVLNLCAASTFSQHSMVANNLRKNFGDLQAVRGIYLALRPGECFGLLGVNGAGKTTTFRILAALISMNEGEAYMPDLVLSRNARTWQSKIGYCPQEDALLEKLNAFETLFMFGRLRGVPEKRLGAAVDLIIDIVDLREHAHKTCRYYSGGNKRKLSIAVALIGFPEVVFLDEPFAGVDVVSRARIHKGLRPIKDRNKSTIVLTSHSMQDCEVACDRMCVMVKGQMVCLGTLQRLKDKFGKGCTIQFVLPHKWTGKPDALTSALVDQFPDAHLTEVQQHLLEYGMDTKLPWSVIFQKLEILDVSFVFDHVLVSDSTLENIFIGFAQRAQAAERAKAGSSPSRSRHVFFAMSSRATTTATITPTTATRL